MNYIVLLDAQMCLAAKTSTITITALRIYIHKYLGHIYVLDISIL